ncbi:hypothetical protein LCGC14_0607780 [marine sediment metagenome]|uniref:Uncharacterized protein n=1 Tax=marine sediment metagenome TaxID=412755 RepID=A0A0F9TUX4_9ZZZZ
MTDTNYGVDFQQEISPSSGTFATIGEVVNLDVPKIVTEAVEKTHHASGGHREHVPSGLIGMDEFPIILNCTQLVVESMYVLMVANSVLLYKIVFPEGLVLDPWEFDAFPLSVDVQESDARAPEVLQVEIMFKGTGVPQVATP